MLTLPSFLSRRKRAALVAALVFVSLSILGAAATSLGLFRWTDGLVSDALTVVLRQETNPSPSVIQIEIPLHTDMPSAEIVFARVAKAKPKLAVLIGPVEPSLAQLARDHGIDVLAPSPIAPPTGGAYRRQSLSIDVNGVSELTVEGLVAQRLGIELSRRDFPIDFRMAQTALPTFTAHQVHSGNIDPGILENRVVLIGYESPSGFPQLSVLQSANEEISPLRFHAYASSSVIDQLPLSETGFIVCIIAILGTGAVAAWGFTRFDDVAGIWGLAILLGAVLIIWVGAFEAGSILPYTAQIIAAGGIFAFVRTKRQQEKTAAIQRMVRSLATQATEDLMARRPKDQDEYWGRIVTMIIQILDLRRLIFLEVPPGQQRVGEVAAHNCSLSDIKEPRRDFRRHPYTTALDANGPILLDRQFFDPADEPEAQYLVPLTFAGEVLGFWAFTIEQTRAGSFADQLKAVFHLADQISQLLYQRRQMKIAFEDENKNNVSVEMQLAGALRMVQLRGSLIEDVLSSVYTATIVYDYFGNVLHISQGLSGLAQRMNIQPFRMTALDFILSITDIKSDAARTLIRQAVLGCERTIVPLKEPIDGLTFVLSITPVRRGQQDDDQGTQALLCELIDVSEFRSRDRLRQLVSDFLGVTLRNDLQALTMTISLLDDPRASASQKQQISAMLRGVVKRALDGITEIHTSIEREEKLITASVYPIDVVALTKEALSMKTRAFEKASVSVALDAPNFCPLVLARADEYKAGMLGILDILCGDTIKGETVNIRITESSQNIRSTFSSNGYGISQETLDDLLRRQDNNDFSRVGTLMRMVAECGGHFEAHSKVGDGFRFMLSINKPSAHP